MIQLYCSITQCLKCEDKNGIDIALLPDHQKQASPDMTAK